MLTVANVPAKTKEILLHSATVIYWLVGMAVIQSWSASSYEYMLSDGVPLCELPKEVDDYRDFSAPFTGLFFLVPFLSWFFRFIRCNHSLSPDQKPNRYWTIFAVSLTLLVYWVYRFFIRLS